MRPLGVTLVSALYWIRGIVWAFLGCGLLLFAKVIGGMMTSLPPWLVALALLAGAGVAYLWCRPRKRGCGCDGGGEEGEGGGVRKHYPKKSSWPSAGSLRIVHFQGHEPGYHAITRSPAG